MEKHQSNFDGIVYACTNGQRGSLFTPDLILLGNHSFWVKILMAVLGIS